MRVALAVSLLVGCGRLGFGDDAPGDALVDDATQDPGIVELSFRGGTPCVRSGTGRVACWGSNNNGQAGVDSTSPNVAPNVLSLTNIVKIATGEFTGFAIDRDGALWGWGQNSAGQLGLGAATPAMQASPVRVPVPEPVVDVVAGEWHTCAVTAGARELYCWGENQCGAIGNGNQLPFYSPFKVPGVTGVQRVAVTDAQTCFTTTGGALQCMGASDAGAGFCDNLRLAPTTPPNLPAAIDIEGGCHMSMCATDPAGIAWCWGANVAGQLGDGANTTRLDPSRVSVIANVTKVGTGFSVSCAATSNDDLFCFGGNDHGQLGIDNMSVAGTASPLQLPFFTGQPIDQIEAGCGSACVRTGHDVYCWGANANTLVIDDTGNDAYAPTKRLGLPF